MLENANKWHVITFAIAAVSLVATIGMLLHYKTDLVVSLPVVGIFFTVVGAMFTKQLGGKPNDANNDKG